MDELDIKTISKRSVQGVLALSSRTFLLQIVNFIAFLVISSILLPSELGIFVAVTAMQRVISFLTDFGLGAALIQKKDALTDQDVITSFTLQVVITGTVFLVVFLLREQIATFFRLDNSGELLLLSLVFTIFLSSFKTIPSILLERALQFNKLVIPQIVEQLTFTLIVLFLVLQGLGVISYAWAFLISALVSIPVYYKVSPWKIGLGLDRTSLHHLKFGGQFQAKNILATVKDDLLTVILTRFLTFTEIGYIGFAQRLAFFVFRYIVDSVTKVSFSTYSRLQDSKEHLKTAIEKSLFFVTLSMFPLLIGLMITGPYFIEYYPKWHEKYEPAVLTLIFFCLNALLSSVSSIFVNVLDATGRVKTTLKLMVLWTILTWTITPLAIQMYGYNGVAIASFLVSLTLGLTVYLLKQVVDFALIKSIFVPTIASLIMMVSVLLIETVFVRDVLTLGVAILFGGAIYGSIVYLLAKEQIMRDITFIRHKA